MVDAFDTAFAEIMKLGEAEPDASFGKTTPPTSPPAPETPPTSPPASETPPTELEVSKEGEGGESGSEEPPVPGAKAPVLDDEAVERLLSGLAARVPVQQVPQGGRGQGAAPMPQPALVTPEETQFLETTYKDWPDVMRAVEIVARVVRTTTEQRIFMEVAAALKPKFEMLDALATRAQLDYFEKAVPNYDQIVEQIGPWVQSQPAYLRAAYEHVIQNGTEDEVLDLINRYQAVSGGGQTQAPPTQPAQRSATELSPAAKQAAARLAPVRSTRTTPPTNAGPTDFDSAFVEALKSI